MKLFTTLAASALTLTMATTAIAQNSSGPLKARQGQFQILAINLGILGGMAKGEVEYTAEAAAAAAGSIVGVSMVAQDALWPEGTDEMSLDGTRAKASIWDEREDFLAKWSDLGTAAAALQTAAATGPEAIGPALGMIGGTCKACHEAHRAPAN